MGRFQVTERPCLVEVFCCSIESLYGQEDNCSNNDNEVLSVAQTSFQEKKVNVKNKENVH